MKNHFAASLATTYFMISTSVAASPVISFPNDLKTLSFQIQTDQIRGGKTKAGLFIDSDSQFIFAGELHLLNGAGFGQISISRLDSSIFDLSSSSTVTFTAKGDGRAYRILFRDRQSIQSGDEIVYEGFFRSSFSTQTFSIRLSNLVAMRRGKVQPQTRQIDLSRVASIGFEIADKIEMPFWLSVGSIKSE